MSTYKIINITNSLGKREHNFNAVLNVEYVDNITKKIIAVKPGETVFLTVPSLPLSVHRLRIKNLITVSEIGTVELTKLVEEAKPKTVKKSVVVDDDEEKIVAAKTAFNKKKLSKKEEETETEA